MTNMINIVHFQCLHDEKHINIKLKQIQFKNVTLL